MSSVNKVQVDGVVYDIAGSGGGGGGGAVDSVNGMIGDVVLDASDVGALPDTTTASDLGAYVLPSGGIPSTDLASAVQTSLGKADTAVQPTEEVTISSTGAVTQALDAGKIYHFTGSLTSLTITLNATSGLAQYHFDFLSGSTAPTLTMPNTVVMPDSFAVEANKRYEVDVLNGYGAVISWATS